MNRWALLWLNLAIRWDEWHDRRLLLGDSLLDALHRLSARSVLRRS